MASVNKVILMGNAGQEPTLRYLPDGKAACSISIATSTKRKDKNTGETIEDTQWHRVQFFDKLAEIVGEYVKKGSPIYVEGRLKYGKYTNKDGAEQNTCDIVATEMQLLGSKSANQSQGQPAQRPAAPQQRPAARQAMPPKAESGFSDMDDDLPFVSCDWALEVDTSKSKRMRNYDF